MNFDPRITAAFTGRRTYGRQSDDALDAAVARLAGSGYVNFLCGMALGFDMAAAEAVLRLRQTAAGDGIRLVAVVPFAGQPQRYPRPERQRYERIVAAADEIVCLADGYSPECYARRNDFLVDSSSVLVAWYDGRPHGGTHYTIARARRRRLRIINLRPSEQLSLGFGDDE